MDVETPMPADYSVATTVNHLQPPKMTKTGSSLKGKKKRTWTNVEDDMLKQVVEEDNRINGPSQKRKWSKIAENLDNARTGKQCRERWQNHLRPNLKKGNWTREEDEKIYRFQQKYGNQWSKITPFLPGRTQNDIRNRWHSGVRSKRIESTIPSIKFSSCRKLENAHMPAIYNNDRSSKDRIEAADESMYTEELYTPIAAHEYTPSLDTTVPPKALEVLMNLNINNDPPNMPSMPILNVSTDDVELAPVVLPALLPEGSFSLTSPLYSPTESPNAIETFSPVVLHSTSTTSSSPPPPSHFTFEEV